MVPPCTNMPLTGKSSKWHVFFSYCLAELLHEGLLVGDQLTLRDTVVHLCADISNPVTFKQNTWGGRQIYNRRMVSLPTLPLRRDSMGLGAETPLTERQKH